MTRLWTQPSSVGRSRVCVSRLLGRGGIPELQAFVACIHLRGRQVWVSNTAGSFNAISVAEHAFAFILAFSKKLLPRAQGLKEGRWMVEPSIALYGKTLGILGLGRIGIEVAKRGAAFGMRLIAVKRKPDPQLARALGLDFLGGIEGMPHVLRNSDFVVVCLPVTNATTGLVAETELRMMKSTSFLVNVARGPIVDESALYRALKGGWIAGAGIDTWYRYPMDPEALSSLGIHKLDNAIGTPHIGGITSDSIAWYLDMIAANAKRLSRGETPVNLIELTQYL